MRHRFWRCSTSAEHPEPLLSSTAGTDVPRRGAAALVESPYVTHPAAQMFRDGEPPPWWPLAKWNKAQLERTRPTLEKVYAAVEAQRARAGR